VVFGNPLKSAKRKGKEFTKKNSRINRAFKGEKQIQATNGSKSTNYELRQIHR
jgi:hypothetical protein